MKIDTNVDDAKKATDATTTDLPPMARHALAWFYDRLTLGDADRKTLFAKRGLTDATIDWLGFRSNPQSNKDLLHQMAADFPPEVLVDCGLWTADEANPASPPKPNAQFYGMSIAEKRDVCGKKVRDQDGEAVRECVWNNPILIPYFNEAGDLVHLRPHKGMMAGKSPQFYVARGRPLQGKTPQMKAGLAIISEGEFKAAALWQVLGTRSASGRCPASRWVNPCLARWRNGWKPSGAPGGGGLRQRKQGGFRPPGFHRIPERRFDAHIWARYLARQFSKQGYDGKVCVLPDDWRDGHGKADWDGRLAAVVAKLGLADGTAVEWDKVRDQIRAQFLVVVQAAHPIGEFRHTKIFDPEMERIIWRGLDKISYEPCLPIGDEQEQVIARRLYRLGSPAERKELVSVERDQFSGNAGPLLSSDLRPVL